jgi:hypothetical protein
VTNRLTDTPPSRASALLQVDLTSTAKTSPWDRLQPGRRQSPHRKLRSQTSISSKDAPARVCDVSVESEPKKICADTRILTRTRLAGERILPVTNRLTDTPPSRASALLQVDLTSTAKTSPWDRLQPGRRQLLLRKPQSQTSISSNAAPSALPWASSASDRVTPPLRMPGSTKLSACTFGSS